MSTNVPQFYKISVVRISTGCTCEYFFSFQGVLIGIVGYTTRQNMVFGKENTYLRIKPAGSLESGKLTLDVKRMPAGLQACRPECWSV